MKRVLVLGLLLTVGGAVMMAAQQPAANAPKVVEVEKVKDNLYVLRGGGGNTAVFVMANGVAIVSRKSAPHPHPLTGNITQACDVCHNTRTYDLGGIFDHGVLARHPIACSSCHEGLSATGKIPNHIPTVATSPETLDCRCTRGRTGPPCRRASGDGRNCAQAM